MIAIALLVFAIVFLTYSVAAPVTNASIVSAVCAVVLILIALSLAGGI